MFKLYAQGVIGSQNGIKILQEQWRSAEAQNLFEHSRKSLTTNADLSASTSIPSHGWTERERRQYQAKKNSGDESADESGATLTNEEVLRIISEVQETWPSSKVDIQDDMYTISVCYQNFR